MATDVISVSKNLRGGNTDSIPKLSRELCSRLLADLEQAKRPVIYATKCSLDNANYSQKVGFEEPPLEKGTDALEHLLDPAQVRGQCLPESNILAGPLAELDGLSGSTLPRRSPPALRTLEHPGLDGIDYARSMAATSFALVMLVIAAAMALILGIVGIYGVIAYAVTQRQREIGIRAALGASRRELEAMFVRHGLVLALIGVVCGLAAAAAFTRLMTSLLFGTSAMDPTIYVLVALGLAGVAALASYLPARRAALVDPMLPLRGE
jgi:hypothetical protein